VWQGVVAGKNQGCRVCPKGVVATRVGCGGKVGVVGVVWWWWVVCGGRCAGRQVRYVWQVCEGVCGVYCVGKGVQGVTGW